MLGWFKKKFSKSPKVSETTVEEEIIEEIQPNIDVEDDKSETAQPHETVDVDAEKAIGHTHSLKDRLTGNAESSIIEEPAKELEDVPSISTEITSIPPAEDSQLVTAEDEAIVEQVIEDAKPTEENVAIKEEEQIPVKKESPSFLNKLADKLTRTRESFTYQIDALFLGKKEIDAELLDDLEEILITSDLGVAITQELLEHARRKVKRKELSDPESLKVVLKQKLKSYIIDNDKPAELVMPKKGPFVIMVIGVNGVGKTTTIGKIAHKFVTSGQSVLLVAGDTYRAAAVSQLTIWAERNGVDIVAKENADPSSVAFDGMDKAKSGNYDVVLVDTAGRLHTQTNLMDELKKIKRVISKQINGAPHEVMLVIDATTGQNGVSQAKLFDAAVDITGITLTKLDGTAKGGIVANIAKEMKTPIRFIGVGEQINDLRDFNPDEFIDALFQAKQ